MPDKFAYSNGLLEKVKMATQNVDSGSDSADNQHQNFEFENPNTGLNQTYREMLEDCIWDEHLQIRLLPFTVKSATTASS